MCQRLIWTFLDEQGSENVLKRRNRTDRGDLKKNLWARQHALFLLLFMVIQGLRIVFLLTNIITLFMEHL